MHTLNRLNALAHAYEEQFGEKLEVYSLRRHGDGSSWHDSGQAFDVAGGGLETNGKGEREWLMQKGQELGLTSLDEYAHPSANATGGHIHFSNRGGGESTGLNFDAQGAQQYEQALLAKARAIQRKHQAEISQVVDSYLERIESGNEDPNALILEIRNSGLTASVKKRLINDITGGSSGSSRRGGSGAGGGIKTSTWNTMRKIDIKLRRGEELTASDRVSLDNAIEELKANGAFDDDTDAGNDFYNLQLNPDKGGRYGFDRFTTNLDNGSSLSDEYLRMVEAGKANSLAALRMINAAYPSYD